VCPPLNPNDYRYSMKYASLLNLGSNDLYSLKIWFSSMGLRTLFFSSSPDLLVNMGLDDHRMIVGL